MTDFTLKRELLLKAVKDGQYPRHLYKYRSDSELTEAIFTNLSLWFSAPQSFNDPFDCNLSEVSSHTQEEADQFLHHILEGRPDRDELLSRGTTVAKAENVLAASKDTVLSQTGVLCLSTSFDSLLMWSHYTNSHKGLVIEFDITQDADFFLSPIKVKYTDNYEPTNYFIDQHATITKIISTKASCWSYENEVRIIKNGVTGAVPINPKAIRRIIFGCKSDRAFIAKVRNACSTPQLQHVQFSKLAITYAKFALELREVET